MSYRVMALALVGLSLTGCVKQYEVIEAPQSAGDTYVVVQATKAGGVKLWDCRSTPDGSTWDPTCVRVRMENSARGDAAPQPTSK